MFNICRCKEIMAERQLSNKDVANMAGTREINLSQWLSAEKEPNSIISGS